MYNVQMTWRNAAKQTKSYNSTPRDAIPDELKVQPLLKHLNAFPIYTTMIPQQSFAKTIVWGPCAGFIYIYIYIYVYMIDM